MTQFLIRGTAFTLIAAASAGVTTTAALAADAAFPTQPIKLIVPFPRAAEPTSCRG
ncbi:hypothetical protein ACFJIX_06960 [Roseateles sp. UC29_93]|uniref:hypothetical protein n=1 Tax=Roseateles sp. UC29_93 TaxID=3350177 RepID=UPI003671FB50